MAGEPTPTKKGVVPTTPQHDEFADFRSPDEASFDKFVRALDRAYHRPLTMMWRSFLHGLMVALGATVGLSLVFAGLAYLLHLLGGVSYFEPAIEQLQDIIMQNELQRQSGSGLDSIVNDPNLQQYLSPTNSPSNEVR